MSPIFLIKWTKILVIIYTTMFCWISLFYIISMDFAIVDPQCRDEMDSLNSCLQQDGLKGAFFFAACQTGNSFRDSEAASFSWWKERINKLLLWITGF